MRGSRQAMQIEVTQGDITREATDAVVNAANGTLLGGLGVDGAIHRAAGPRLLAACEALRASRFPEGLATGDAVATEGFALAARWVIHTVGPVYGSEPEAPRLLARCHVRSLAVADELGARTVAFPAISTGAYGYPLDEAARVALGAVAHAATEVEIVRFVLFSTRALDAFRAAARELAIDVAE